MLMTAVPVSVGWVPVVVPSSLATVNRAAHWLVGGTHCGGNRVDAIRDDVRETVDGGLRNNAVAYIWGG